MLRGDVEIVPPRKIKPGLIVHHGDLVRIRRNERGAPATPGPDALFVLVDGRQSALPFLVLNKPPGLLVHRSSVEVSKTVTSYLADRFPTERVEAVHRLDRDTSGCLVCGVGIEAIRILRAAFAGSVEAEKEYLAVLLDPCRIWRVGMRRQIDTPLGFDAESTVKLRVGVGDWRCATIFTALHRVGEYVLVQAKIRGGRQHQIRAHAALEGTPVLGDKLYAMGNRFFIDWITSPGDPTLVAALPTRWHCLHASRVRLPLPSGTIEARCPPPVHFPDSLSAWRRNNQGEPGTRQGE